MPQKTISETIEISGIGLHTGHNVKMILKPAEENTGIVFNSVKDGGRISVEALAENITLADRETVLGKDKAKIHTVEHFLAALNILEISNLTVDIDGDEVPVIDGSALGFYEKIKDKVQNQKKEIEPYIIKEPIVIEKKGAVLMALPCPDFKISYTLHYDVGTIRTQYFSSVINSEVFEKNICSARTFGVYNEIDGLKERGLIKGGSLKNAIVFGDDKVFNEEGLRFNDEPVRHKVLDLIGDLKLAGAPLKAHIIAIKSGHNLNAVMVKKIREMFIRSPQYYSALEGNVSFDINGIFEILPHRYPFLLVDKIVSMDRGKKVIGLKNVTINEAFFQGHFPGHPVMPGVLVIEAMAQVGGMMLLSEKENRGKLVYFMGLEKVKWRRPIRPGDQIIFELTPLKIGTKYGVMRGEAYVDGRLSTEAELKFSIIET